MYIFQKRTIPHAPHGEARKHIHHRARARCITRNCASCCSIAPVMAAELYRQRTWPIYPYSQRRTTASCSTDKMIRIVPNQISNFTAARLSNPRAAAAAGFFFNFTLKRAVSTCITFIISSSSAIRYERGACKKKTYTHNS
uniref:Uncharacterized protein n=1 Tax=Trichogramma kaykai TaxID=54128 RepID=A0ABD2WT96_9HYME